LKTALKTIKAGDDWTEGVFVMDANGHSEHYTRLYGALRWPTELYPGVVLVGGEEHTPDDRLGRRRIRLVAELVADSLHEFLDRLTDAASMLTCDRMYCRAEDVEHYRAIYGDHFRKAGIRKPALTESPYERDVTLGYQLCRGLVQKALLVVPSALQRIYRTINEPSINLQKLKTDVDRFPEYECLMYLVMAFVKFPWKGAQPRRRMASYYQPLDSYTGY